MKIQQHISLSIISLFLLSCLSINSAISQNAEKIKNLDDRVQKFLENRKGTWQDMNVPASDGKILYDIIVKNNYTKALEIGTSTGHSAIWIAWALSKTGGKLITIEIDEGRYKEAEANFKAAGLSEYIDARLADAHQLVKELKGPFDFVFCDADKDWYKNYFIAIYPKLEVGGCYTAHNVSDQRGWRRGGTGEFYDYIKNLPDMKTTVDNSGAGMSISYKKSEK
ncbi:MAG: class I SAM-dependent methyltransferase [bacterium]|nr:class I SAM-dependent methyltransferase [bacterium]